ncbi:hypothetical protein PC116_g15996 [Phytophthora cactorum]|nr:hypothetical protein PC128_g8990 [Phytophthora cactorum]KAG4235904.1 hypothetical protein PC116_g15996 [Phytophthora cactorum]
MKLNKRVDEALVSPNLKTLGHYVDMFNKKYSDRQVQCTAKRCPRDSFQDTRIRRG